jgi:hypothetical protein
MFRIAALIGLMLAAPVAAQQANFDQLFGAQPEPVDAGRSNGPGRDDLSIVALYLGDIRVADAIPAHQTDKGLCLAIADVLDSLELAHEPGPGGLAISLIAPPRTVTLPIGDLMETPAGPCATLATLAATLPAQFRDDPGNLRVVITAAEAFPVAARLAREEARRHLSGTGPAPPVLPLIDNPWQLASAPTLDVAATLGVTDARPAVAASLAASGDLFAMQARALAAIAPDGSASLRATLSRVTDQPGMLGMRLFAVGDIVAPAQPLLAAAATGRGLVLSSRPNWRADLFDVVDLDGPLPRGWEAELYRDGQLFAVVTAPDANGNYHFGDVPLRTGYNRYVVKLFGPRGENEERIFTRVVGSELNPENETSYTVGFVEGGVPVLGPRANVTAPPTAFASVEHGLGPALSTRLDVRVSGDTLAGSAALNASLLGGYGSLIAASNGHGVAVAARAARRVGGTDVTLTLAEHGGTPGPDAPPDVREFRRLARLQANGRLPLGRRSVQTQLALGFAEDRNGTTLATAGLGMALSMGSLQLSNQVAGEWRQSRFGSSTRAQGVIGAALPLGDWRLRGAADYQLAPQPQVERLGLSASRSSARQSLTLDAGWDLAGGGPIAGVTATRWFGPVSLGLGAAVTASGWQAGVSLGFSLWRPSGAGYRFGPGGMGTTAGVQPIVFIDDDGDGLPGADETRIEGARFLVDNSVRSEATARDGTSAIGGLAAARPVNVEPQLSSLPDLSLRPAKPGFSVVLRPGQMVAVPVPLTPTGEVEARVLRVAGDQESAIAGVPVVLESASKRIETRTDFDGYASFDGVPFGRYTLSIPGNADVPPQAIVLDRAHASVLDRRLLVPVG